MALVLNWQKKLGYSHDPFIDTPTQNFLGQKTLKEKINLFIIKEQQLAYITVKKGEGYSSFILWLRKELKDELIAIPSDCTTLEKLEKFLFQECVPFYKKKHFGKFLTQVTKKDVEPLKEIYKVLAKEKHMLLFEGKLSSGQVQFCNELLKRTKVQFILTNPSKDVLEKTPDMKVSFGKYSQEELEEMLTKRIEAAGSVGTFPFSQKDISSLYEKAKANPQEFLKLAKDRAIELSLKEIELPKKEKIEKETPSTKEEKEAPKKAAVKKIASTKEKDEQKTASVPKPQEKKKTFSLFGKIKFEVHDEEEQKKKPSEKKQKESNIKKEEEKKDTKEEHKEMEEMLAEIVSANEGGKK